MSPVILVLMLVTLSALIISSTGQSAITAMPIAVWDFDRQHSASGPLPGVNETFLFVGSGTVFNSSCPSSVSDSCRSVDMGNRPLSNIYLYEPNNLGLVGELTVVMYISTEGINTSAYDSTDQLFLMEFTAYLSCQNGQYNGEPFVPSLRYYVKGNTHFVLEFGDFRSCSTRTLSISQSATSSGQWQRIGFSIKYRSSSHACMIYTLEPGGIWTSRGELYCTRVEDIVSAPLVFGQPLTLAEESTAMNFEGKIACLQIFNIQISEDDWYDACDPGNQDVEENLPYYPYFYLGEDSYVTSSTTGKETPWMSPVTPTDETTTISTAGLPTPETFTEMTTTDSSTSEMTTTDSPTSEMTTTDSPTSEMTTTDSPTSEMTTTDSPTSEMTTTDSPTSEMTTTDSPTSEMTTTDSPTSEMTTTDSPTTEMTTTVSPISEITTADSPTSEKTTTDSPTTEISTAMSTRDLPAPEIFMDIAMKELPTSQISSTEMTTADLPETASTPGMITSDLTTGMTTSDLLTTGKAETMPSSATAPWRSDDCQCLCNDQLSGISTGNITAEEVRDLVEDIEKELLIDKKGTSYLKRKKTSATDDRPSSHFVGTFGIFICTAALCLIVGADAAAFLSSSLDQIKTSGKTTVGLGTKINL